jgi:hypothetical protein
MYEHKVGNSCIGFFFCSKKIYFFFLLSSKKKGGNTSELLNEHKKKCWLEVVGILFSWKWLRFLV